MVAATAAAEAVFRHPGGTLYLTALRGRFVVLARMRWSRKMRKTEAEMIVLGNGEKAVH